MHGAGGGFAGHTDWRLPNLTELLPADAKPVVVLDPGHGGVDPGTDGLALVVGQERMVALTGIGEHGKAPRASR